MYGNKREIIKEELERKDIAKWEGLNWFFEEILYFIRFLNKNINKKNFFINLFVKYHMYINH